MQKEQYSKQIIIEASKKYQLPWVLGFSGGKDSTTTLSLLIDAMKEGARITRLYVLYADTLLEQPTLHKEVISALASLKVLNVIPVILRPSEHEDYISIVLEKGYPAPAWYFRWCVNRLKINPVRRFMKSLGNAVKVLGVRSDESVSRMKTTLVDGSRPAIINGPNPTVRPIIFWTEEDVVQYLKTHRRWDGSSFDYLIDLYGYQINDACAPNTFCLVKPKEGATAYTSVRFGCWLCTVVHRNKMPISPLLEKARERIRQVSDDMKYRKFVDGKPRKLNEEGRAEIAKIMLEVLEKEPEAFGYNHDELRKKLERYLPAQASANYYLITRMLPNKTT